MLPPLQGPTHRHQRGFRNNTTALLFAFTYLLFKAFPSQPTFQAGSCLNPQFARRLPTDPHDTPT